MGLNRAHPASNLRPLCRVGKCAFSNFPKNLSDFRNFFDNSLAYIMRLDV
jgi:hypothetical protein